MGRLGWDPYTFTAEDLHDAVCELERSLDHPGERDCQCHEQYV